MQKKEIIVEKERKLVSLLEDIGFDFSQACNMLKKKDVKVDGKPEKSNILLNVGQKVTIYFADDALQKKYEVVFDGKKAVVIYKFSGIESEGMLEETLSAKAVHRLDRNTEGLMVFAKTENAENVLKKAFKNKQIHKFYAAEVVGKFEMDGTFNAYLVKDAEKAQVKIFDKKVAGAQAISTRFVTVKAGAESSLILAELFTGKTHQIRATLAHLNHAIIGDEKYGDSQINKKFHKNRQKLACFCLKFDKIGILELDGQQFCKFPDWLKGLEEKFLQKM